MENKFELVTIRKGEIKTIDAFIQSFNAIGSNMRTLSVTAYRFLTDDNVEIRKEFKTRCLDELHMSPSTISFLKTAGMLYTASYVFYDFPYTNVIFFKKAVDYYIEKNYPNKLDWQFVDDDICENVVIELARLHYSYINPDDTEECKNQLLTLSQKELKNLVEKYTAPPVEVVDDGDVSDDTDDTSEDTTEDSTPTDEEMDEVNSHYITYIDDDIYEVISMLSSVQHNMTKQGMIDIMKQAVDKLNGGMRK